MEALIGAVRAVFAGIDPQLPWYDVRTMEERIADSLADRRTPMLLATGFAAVALLLAAVGIYGVLAYLVELRTREFGIMLAIGYSPRQLFGMVMAESGFLAGLGLGDESAED